MGAPQLFVDDHQIAGGKFTRTFHQPVKEPAPVLTWTDFQTPATLEANGTIVYDPKLRRWVMFALGYSSSAPTDRARLYRFTSRDALRWTGGQRIRIGTGSPDVFSAHYTRGSVYPYEGWAYLWDEPHDGQGIDGTWYVRSRDGVQWEPVRRVIQAESRRLTGPAGAEMFGPSDVTLFSYDPVTRRYLGLFKFYSHASYDGSQFRSRAYLWLNSLDQLVPTHWISKLSLAPPAGSTDEFYGSTAWRYGDMLLGGLKVYRNTTGRAFVRLVSSRDGGTWRQHGTFLGNGPEGSGDGGYMTEFSQGPLRVGRELVFYYGASAWGKNQPVDVRVTGGGIFRARLRVDGFASVRGTVTTRTARFPSRRLTVNHAGPVTVQLLAPGGRVRASERLTGDHLASPVRFRLPPSGRLRFVARGALYSYTFATAS